MGFSQRLLFREENHAVTHGEFGKLKNDAASLRHRYNFRTERSTYNRQVSDRTWMNITFYFSLTMIFK